MDFLKRIMALAAVMCILSGCSLVARPVTTVVTLQPRETTAGVSFAYVLNRNSHKFHNPECASVKDMKDANREDYSGTREQLLEWGFSPCGNCRP